MAAFFPWQSEVQDCPRGQNYYQCSSVPYTGCCSHDPCKTGHCTDDPADSPGSCEGTNTVTVTRTTSQGAATSTTPVAGESPTTQVPSPIPVVPDPTRVNTQLDVASTATTSQTPSPSPPGTASAVTSTLSWSSAATTKTLHLVSASAGTSPSASARPESDAAPSKSTPPGTIAVSVVGSMAGLALIVLLLTWCLGRRKSTKFTFNRKVQKVDPEDEPKDAEAIDRDRNGTLQRLERQSVPSPRPFDFGLPTIPNDSTPIMPRRWM